MKNDTTRCEGRLPGPNGTQCYFNKMQGKKVCGGHEHGAFDPEAYNAYEKVRPPKKLRQPRRVVRRQPRRVRS